MERALRVQDRAWRGLGQVGRALGTECAVYRASGPVDPISAGNVVMRLPAAFVPVSGSFAQPVGYGQALWQGMFDGAYTRPGDFLRKAETAAGAGDGGIWFVAAQQMHLPILCVRASRIASFSRPIGPQAAGINGYGGVTDAGSEVLLGGWPAAVLDGGAGGGYQANLPTGTSLGAWTVLLAGYPGVTLRAGDHMGDDLGRTGVVSAAELSDLGWRLHVVQAAT